MTEETSFQALQTASLAHCMLDESQEIEKTPQSQPSTQESSHKSSFDGIQNLCFSAVVPKVLLKEMAFPTGRLSLQLSHEHLKAESVHFQPLSDLTIQRVLKNQSNLLKVLETLEEKLQPVDLKIEVRPARPAIVMGLPTTSTLLRTRKNR